MRDWRKEIEKRLAGLNLPPEREAEIAEEFSAHLEDKFQEELARGADEETAFRVAMVELDEADLTGELRSSETARQEPIPEGKSGSGVWALDLWGDVRYGARMLRKSPGFTAAAVLALAIGIGANTAAFTIVNTLLLHPLPVSHPSRLVAMHTTLTARQAKGANARPLSYPNLSDFAAQNRAFQSVAGYSATLAATMENDKGSQRVFAQVVTPNYFPTLGLRPRLGRFFAAKDDVAPGSDPVAVIGYAAWQNLFGGSASILGRRIRLNQTPFTIIGVAPKGFLGISAVFGPDIWVPTMMAESVLPGRDRDALTDRSMLVFTGAARLKPGISLRMAQANMQTVADGLAREYPSADEGQTVSLEPIDQAAIGTYGGGSAITRASTLLMAIVLLVLLIACSNVANMLLARASVRRREIAVRLALGASRPRLVRQLLMESLLMSLLGGVVGFGFGYAGCQMLWALRPASTARNLASLKLDPQVFLFTLLVAAFAGLLFGISPALRSSRVPVVDALKDGQHGASHGPGRVTVARSLLVGQVAISLVLLVVAGLFLRSLANEYTIDPGIQTKHLALFLLYPSQAGYRQTQTEQFYKEVRQRLSSVPGVVSVAWGSNLPFWGQPQTGMRIPGRTLRTKSEALSSIVDTVGTSYFRTVGIPLLAGRNFRVEDGKNSAPVAIINDTMAKRYWPKGNALGQQVEAPGQGVPRRIVGIVRTVDYTALGEPPQPCIYIPLRQNYMGSMVLYVRTQRAPAVTIPDLRSELGAIAPALPIQDVRTGTEVVDQALWGTKIGVGLLGVFGLLALGLASLGLYGVMAYSVNQRRREVGIRMALGASRADVVQLILRQGMTLVGVGVGLGLTLSILAGAGLSRFLYGVAAADLPSLAGGSLVLLAVAFVACYLPARAASRVDPQTTLRESG